MALASSSMSQSVLQKRIFDKTLAAKKCQDVAAMRQLLVNVIPAGTELVLTPDTLKEMNLTCHEGFPK